MRQRVGPDLDMHGAGFRTLAAFLQPGRAVAVRAPQAPALPAGVRVVDARVEALGEEAQGVRDAQHHYLPVLEGDETVVEVRGRDRDLVAAADRVVLVDPGVIACLRLKHRRTAISRVRYEPRTGEAHADQSFAAARVHHAPRRCGACVAGRRTGAATGNAGGGFP